MTNRFITVGVDGSASSSAALRLAVEEARVRQCGVRVVTAWQAATIYAADSGALFPEERTAYERKAAELQEQAVRSVTGDGEELPLIERRLVRGDPGPALVALSHDADLLAVGTEHKGILKRVTAGSTSVYCIRHSQVPVVVVPFVTKEQVVDGGTRPPHVAVGAGPIL
jgi:nucleotide-binding universal stress UspA family protein